jgi:hypothetical protein
MHLKGERQVLTDLPLFLWALASSRREPPRSAKPKQRGRNPQPRRDKIVTPVKPPYRKRPR